ncbi:MAG: flavodoxin family protein, partial [Clostridia bacterium]|nr:flavodoxin family protein [Clostridia bacterium]
MAEHKTLAVMRASPRKRGNTNWLTDIVVSELRAGGCDVIEFDLFDMTIKPCTACRWCQKDWNRVSCVQKDDMQPIFDAIMK